MSQEIKQLTRDQFNELKNEMNNRNLEVVANTKITHFMIVKDGLKLNNKNTRFILVKNKNGDHALNAGQLEFLKQYNVKYSKSVDFNYIEIEALIQKQGEE